MFDNSFTKAEDKDSDKNSILNSIKEYFHNNHSSFSRKDFLDDSDFIPGITNVPYSGRVFDETEMINCTSSVLDFWLTLGQYGQQFEEEFAKFLGKKAF